MHRTGYSSDDLRGVDWRENACPPVAYISDLIQVSHHMFFSSLKSGHLKETIIKEQSRKTHTDRNTKYKQRVSHGPKLPPEKTKDRNYSRIRKRCLLSFSTRLELFVFFVAFLLVFGFVTLLQGRDIHRSSDGSRVHAFRRG